jgi:hypothetical protein
MFIYLCLIEDPLLKPYIGLPSAYLSYLFTRLCITDDFYTGLNLLYGLFLFSITPPITQVPYAIFIILAA